MNKLIKIGNIVVVQLEDGRSFNKEITKQDFNYLYDIIDNTNDVLKFFIPEYDKYEKDKEEYNTLIESISNIDFLSYNNSDQSVYWLDISPLSLPQDFVMSIIRAYETGNSKALNAYKNFWILLSLNPNDECRKNLWWFLNYHGLKISSSGFFVSYRNAVTTNEKDDEGNTIYTDAHSHSTKISIGHTVSIPREKCNPDNKVLCSTGLICSPVY